VHVVEKLSRELFDVSCRVRSPRRTPDDSLAASVRELLLVLVEQAHEAAGVEHDHPDGERIEHRTEYEGRGDGAHASVVEADAPPVERTDRW